MSTTTPLAMRKLVVSCCGLMLIASTALAQVQGLHMRWSGCPNHPAATETENFLCDGATHSLHGTFSLDAPVAGFVAMDGIIDLLFATPDVPPFWQFQERACNESGLQLFDGRPTVNCATTANTSTMCGTGGTGCDAFITAYAYGGTINFPSNRARMLFSLVNSVNPRSLAANTGTNAHFAIQFVFLEDNAAEVGGRCDGCMAGVSLTWNLAVFYNNNARPGGEAVSAIVSSSDPGSIDATVYVNCTGCQTVNARARRWGQLKALYR